MNIWKFIHAKLSEGIELMLLIVVASEGSSPGKPGFKMAVTKNKDLFGSIGGGTMEFEMVELAFSKINSPKQLPYIKTQTHNENGAEKSGMICSGKTSVAFFPLNKSNLSTVKQIITAIENSNEGLIKIDNRSFSYVKDEKADLPIIANILSENEWNYIEKPGKLNKICIIGAGHVGLALSKIMRELEFVVELYDDRLGINTFENNEYVNKKHKINYNDIDTLLPEGDNIYAVIMTFGHLSDELVLSKIINKKFRYLGMLGSKTKVGKIFERVGFDPDSNSGKKIFSPIGIPINSQTPAEIAVSIAAEIIQVKNSNL